MHSTTYEILIQTLRPQVGRHRCSNTLLSEPIAVLPRLGSLRRCPALAAGLATATRTALTPSPPPQGDSTPALNPAKL